MLRNEKRAICKKRRGMLYKSLTLSWQCTSSYSRRDSKDSSATGLQHPPYSPDLAQSDYHIFGPPTEASRGRRFTCNDEAKEAVHTCLPEQPKSFSAWIQTLVERYNKFTVLQGWLCRKICKIAHSSITAVKCILRLLFDSPSYNGAPLLGHFDTGEGGH